MNTRHERLATIVLIVVVTCLSVRFSAGAGDEQTEPAANASLAAVALIDVGKVFKENAEFKEEIEAIRAGVAEAQIEFTKQQQALAVLIAEHSKLTPGTKDYSDLEQQISTEQAKLQAKIKRRQAHTVSQEAETYASHYNHLRQVVEQYAKEHQIRLVLRQNTGEMNPDEPKSVLESINRFVVFEDQLDITDDILRVINSH